MEEQVNEVTGEVVVRGTDYGTTTSETFQGAAIERRAETAAVAAAEQARAHVEARYVMALRRPRDINTVRVRLLTDCKRPAFAEVALYSKPTGGKSIVGPSIRLAEAALRHMGNVEQDNQTIFDDANKRIVRVSVTDLESNTTYATEVTIDKTVERKNPKDRTVVSKRTNSYNESVYLVVATEDELLQKVNSLVSKAMRTNGLRLVPGDILEEAMRLVRTTLAEGIKKDPDAARKRMADAFAENGIMPNQLVEFLGYPFEQISAADAATLHGIYTAIKEGDTTWAAVMEQRRAERGEVGDGKKATASGGGLRDRVKAKAAAAKGNAADGTEAEPPADYEPGSDG